MIIYTKKKDYKIWVNTKDKTFHIQMTGKKTEKAGHDTAALAIESADDRVQGEDNEQNKHSMD